MPRTTFRWPLLLLLAAAPAGAQTIDFEDLVGAPGGTGQVPDSYHGFAWGSDIGSGAWATAEAGNIFSMPSLLGQVSAWSSGGAALYVSRATPFSFTSAAIAGRFGLCFSASVPTQTVHGYYLGALVGTSSFALNCNTYDVRAFGDGFDYIDELRFERTTPFPTNLVLDDLVFGAALGPAPVVGAVPEPSTVLLLAGGLLGVAATARRRRAAGGAA
jgi:hypothetical protein